jgi:hypothetical protein
MIKIRMVKTTDLETCYAVETAAFPATHAASRSSVQKRITAFLHGFYVAELSEQIVGMINGGAWDEMAIKLM